ncbi:TcpQ domain-containing protein [Achromobacter sp. 77]|uniref:TcpQ domain-containing protein n=1 Tax=Achromobacter sp. 77 TaxID=2756133 RepID=UPI001D00B2B1|nr:TcpQ domain-containing protein [Achromobacter sp. 77]UDG77372.1 TcpQ domain-containing protein [Achromobacter sp. 77]
MVRILFLAAGLSCLGACSWSGPGPAGGSSWQSGIPSSQGFRFDWQLSGDPAVAPLQVFDDGRETWLQFLPGQPLPAIFGMGDGGEHPLPYVRRDPYVVVAGAWNGLSFRGGRLTARARRAHAAPNPAREPASAARLALPTAAGPDPSQRPPQDASAAITLSADTPARSDGHALAGALVAPQAAPFRAAPPDATLRAVLARWADSAGWTFQPQHWAVDVDIPLAATAEFPGDFKTAVRGLLGATELADRPLQPCFYGNRVLRVVPLAQSCSRAATPKGAAA